MAHLILTIFFAVFGGILALCPPQCLCTNGDVVCSCENTINSELSLVSLGAAFVRSLTVHSCHRLSIANDTFEGVVLADRISLISISRLIIEPHAFRGILQSPRQIVIDRCHLPILLPNTFTGLSHVEHLWFRNSSINSIHGGAFDGLTDVVYVYFRDVQLKHLRANAFAGLKSIKHFYLRGSIDIQAAEHELFYGSSIEEIVWDDVRAKVDEGFLAGTNCDGMLITNSQLTVTARGDKVQLGNRKNSSLSFENVVLNTFVPKLYMDFGKISIKNCSISKIRNREISVSKYKRQLHIQDSTIENVEPDSFSGLAFKSFIVNGSSIASIEKRSFAEIEAEDIKFMETTIGDVGHAVWLGAKIGHFEFKRSQVHRWLGASLKNATIDLFEIVDSGIENLQGAAWGNARIREIRIGHTKIGRMSSEILDNTKVFTMSLYKNQLHVALQNSLLAKTTPTHLVVSNNKIRCESDDCEANSLQFRPFVHPLLWKFEGNTCLQKVTQACFQPSTVYYPGLICRSHWRLLECICSESTVAELPVKTNLTIMVLGDCEELEVKGGDNSLRALYLYRISKLSIESLPSKLDTLEIFHAGVSFKTRAINSQTISILRISDSKILGLEEGMARKSRIRELYLDRTYLPFSHKALENSNVESLIVNGSLIEDLNDLLPRVDGIRMEHSVLATAPRLVSVPKIQLHNNTVICCCHYDPDCYPNSSMCEAMFSDLKCRPSASVFPGINLLFLTSFACLWL